MLIGGEIIIKGEIVRIFNKKYKYCKLIYISSDLMLWLICDKYDYDLIYLCL